MSKDGFYKFVTAASTMTVEEFYTNVILPADMLMPEQYATEAHRISSTNPSGIPGCICDLYVKAPCAFCVAMTQEERDIWTQKGYGGLREWWHEQLKPKPRQRPWWF